MVGVWCNMHMHTVEICQGVGDGGENCVVHDVYEFEFGPTRYGHVLVARDPHLGT